jgi:serine protease Do
MEWRRILTSSAVLLLCVGPLTGSQPVRMFGLEEEAGYLGISMRDVTADDVAALQLPREAGVLVRRVEPDSPAAEAGLREGDVVLEYAGIPVLGTRQFRRLVSETPPGRNVDMEIRRAGGSFLLSAEIGRREVGPPVGVPGEAWSFRVPERGWRWEDPSDYPGILMYRPGPRLGIEGAPLTAQMADFLGIAGTRGVLVMEVAADSPAEKAGLKAGDVVTAAGGRPVANRAQLSRAITAERVELDVVRDGRPLKLTVEMRADSLRRREAERL